MQPASPQPSPNQPDPNDIAWIKSQIKRPTKVVITGGMPYANGPLHMGHLAGALIPPDIYARFMSMLIGKENVLFVCGNDDHGSTSELAAHQAGVPVRQFIDKIHAEQSQTLKRYAIEPSIFSGTSQPDCFPTHSALAQDFIRNLAKNGMLEKRTSKQWFDTKLNRFLQDRLVRGQCPNPKCNDLSAYSDECDVCGTHYKPEELIHPKSAVSDSIPELRDTTHWWLDLWQVGEELRVWIQSKEKLWRQAVYNEVIHRVLPSLSFDNTHEEKYKTLKAELPAHKSKYAAGKQVALSFQNRQDLVLATKQLLDQGIPSRLLDDWAHRSISRDVPWGIPMPVDVDPDMKGKTLYVWPDSLIAPIAFTKVALTKQGRDPADYANFWKDPNARIVQFLGQDNVYFYVLMQGAMWLGQQANPHQLPGPQDLQLTDVYSCHHLMVEGEKMSKSRGNFYSANELLDEKGYDGDQIRYFLSTLNLAEKASNFDFKTLDERNNFLAGPLNAAFEKPIAACLSKFEGRVPQGQLNEKVQKETAQIIRKYLRSMERAEHPVLLNLIENYARQINSMFTQFKPHDDRADLKAREDALYSCFYVLKNIMIMLYPFAPTTMDRLRQTLKLPETVWSIDELGTAIPANHQIGAQVTYFPGKAVS